MVHQDDVIFLFSIHSVSLFNLPFQVCKVEIRSFMSIHLPGDSTTYIYIYLHTEDYSQKSNLID